VGIDALFLVAEKEGPILYGRLVYLGASIAHERREPSGYAVFGLLPLPVRAIRTNRSLFGLLLIGMQRRTYVRVGTTF
jgi:hypothetical protein